MEGLAPIFLAWRISNERRPPDRVAGFFVAKAGGSNHAVFVNVSKIVCVAYNSTNRWIYKIKKPRYSQGHFLLDGQISWSGSYHIMLKTPSFLIPNKRVVPSNLKL